MIADVDLGTADATRTHTVEVARWFAAAGFDVELVTRGPDPALAGVRHHRSYGASAATRFASSNRIALRLVWRERRRARRCYVRHDWAQTPVVAFARILRYRVVVQVDDLPFGRGYEEPIARSADVVRRVTMFAVGRLATSLVAVTDGIRSILVRDYHVDESKIAVLPNGVDLARFQPQDRARAVERAGLAPGLRYVVFTGRFAPWVDFETMLHAFALVARERPDARLLLVGGGPRRGDVERLVDELEIRAQTIVTGFVREPERVRDYIGAATVCLAAHRAPRLARIGASPVKLAEYFASARAVVAVGIPGVREMIDESGGGVAVPPEPAAMARAVGSLLDDAARADELGAAGRRAAEERYSWQSVVARTLPLFGLDQVSSTASYSRRSLG